LQFARANAQTKNCKRACFPTRLKIVFSLSKKIKNTVNRKNENIALNDGQPTTSSLARFFLPQAQHRKNLAKLPNRYAKF
jgi:hypothetical protein